MDSRLLEIENLTLRFGGLKAVDGVSFKIKQKEILAVIGPNGAGKTTIFNCINGLYRPQRGEITFRGIDLLSLRPHEIAKMGIARTFQNIELYKHLNVLDHLLVAQHTRMKSGMWNGALFLKKTRKDEEEGRRRAKEILVFLGLEKEMDRRAVDLPFVSQKLLELGRALALAPHLLLLDEPSSGMSAEESQKLCQIIINLRDQFGMAILLVEHNVGLVMKVSERIVVLNFGKKIAEGSPEEIKNNSLVIEAYLGAPRSHAENP